MTNFSLSSELNQLFPTNVITIQQDWLNEGEQALSETLNQNLDNKKELLQWTESDAGWDPLVQWLRRSNERFKDSTAHYILLWLASDKIHGFWNRKRDRSLDTAEKVRQIGWSLNARIGVVDNLMGQDKPSSGPNIGHLFRNPLIYRMNPKVKLLPKAEALQDSQTLLKRAWDVLEMPLTLEQIEQLKHTFFQHHAMVNQQKKKQPDGQRWTELVQDKSCEELFCSVNHLALFDVMCDTLSPKNLKRFETPHHLRALCSFWKSYLRQAHSCQIINDYFGRFVVGEEGIGSEC